MLIRSTILAAAVALTIATAGAAHNGGLWFDTGARTARNIERLYNVGGAYCGPIPAPFQSRYHAHSQVENDVRRWDHFLCGLVLSNGTVCLSVAHLTGKEYWAMN